MIKKKKNLTNQQGLTMGGGRRERKKKRGGERRRDKLRDSLREQDLISSRRWALLPSLAPHPQPSPYLLLGNTTHRSSLLTLTHMKRNWTAGRTKSQEILHALCSCFAGSKCLINVQWLTAFEIMGWEIIRKSLVPSAVMTACFSLLILDICLPTVHLL